jgi:hypothetical protein
LESLEPEYLAQLLIGSISQRKPNIGSDSVESAIELCVKVLKILQEHQKIQTEQYITSIICQIKQRQIEQRPDS